MRRGDAKQPGLQIRLLGELAVLRDGVPQVLPPSKKTRALLAYLVATGRPQQREHLCGLLWDGPDDPRAALRWGLTKMRPLLDEARVERLHADREHVSFLAHGADIDLRAVESLAGVRLGDASTDELVAAAARFSGAVLEGLDLPGCHRYHAWCVGLREDMHALHVAIRSTLIARLRTTPEDALRHARVLLGLDPLAESSHISVVRLLGELGRTREAIEQYDRCRQLLERELGAKPSRDLEDARRALSRAAPIAAVKPVAPQAAPEVAGVSAFVARRVERATLAATLDDVGAGRGAPVVLVVGEAGVGKSRLLEELVSMTRAGGGQVLAGRAFEAELVRPYGAWVDALRSGAGSAPASADLAPLLPELGQAAPAGGGDRNRLFEAVTAFLRQRAASAGPLLLLLDDIQWLDEASAALLHFVVRALQGEPVLIACAARGGELGDNVAVLRLVRALARDRRLHQIDLAPLDAAATALLVQSVDRDLDAGAVFAESEGNPLFTLEIARARLAGDGDVSQTLVALIADRLERLDDKARALVPWAAALGRSFDPQILAHVSGTPVSELLVSLDELERRGVVRGTGGSTYDFSHDLIRRTAYQRLSQPRRRLAHLQVARALATLPDTDGSLAGDIAHHAGLGGDSELAARSCLQAGQRCLRMFAAVEARELAQRGLEHARPLPREARIRLCLGFVELELDSLPSPRRFRDLERELTRATVEAEEAGMHAETAKGLYLRSVIQYREGDTAGAHQSSTRVHEVAQDVDVVTRARALGEAARCLTLLEREMPRAKQMLDEAELLLGDGDAFVEMIWARGLLHRFGGDRAKGVSELERSRTIARRTGAHWQETECLRHLAMMDLEGGQSEEAIARCRELADAAARTGEGPEGVYAAALGALARLRRGDADAAQQLEAAVQAVRGADNKALLAFLQNLAAERCLDDGRTDDAEQRAAEALKAATAVDRRSQMAIARALLSRVHTARGDREAARAELAVVEPELAVPAALASMARQAIETARAALSALLSAPLAVAPDSGQKGPHAVPHR